MPPINPRTFPMRLSVTSTAAAQHKEFVTGIAWTASGEVLSSSDDKTVCKWTPTGDCGGELMKTDAYITCMHAFPAKKDMLSITPLVNKAAPYRVGVDIVPVSLIARSPLFLVAHPKTAVSTVQEFVALVKSKPGDFTYGSSGIGSTHHLTMEALKNALNLDVRHVPFKGSGQSTPALVGGQVDFSVAALPSMQGFAKAGQVRVLASNAATRSPQAPEIPTLAELVPGFDFSVVIGVMAAATTPPAAIQRISQEIAEVVKHPELVKNFQTAVIEPVGAGPQAYGQVIARENEAMARAAKVASLKAE